MKKRIPQVIVAYPYKVEQGFYNLVNDNGYEEERSYIRIWAKNVHGDDIILIVRNFYPYLYVKGYFSIDRLKEYMKKGTFQEIKSLNETEKNFFFNIIKTLSGDYEYEKLIDVFEYVYYTMFISGRQLRMKEAIIEMLKEGEGDQLILIRKLLRITRKSEVKEILKNIGITPSDELFDKVKEIPLKIADNYIVLGKKDKRNIRKLYHKLKDLLYSYLAINVSQQYLKQEIVTKKEFITTRILKRVFENDAPPSDEEIVKIIEEELSPYNPTERHVEAIFVNIEKLLSLASEPKILNLIEKYDIEYFNQNFDKIKEHLIENGVFERAVKIRNILITISNIILTLQKQKFTKVYFKTTRKFKLVRSALKLFGYDTREDNIQFELRYMVDSRIKFVWNKFWVHKLKKKMNGIQIYLLDKFNSFEPLTEYELNLYNLPEKPEFKAVYFDIEVYNKRTMLIGEAPVIAIGALMVTYYDSKPVYGEYKVFYNLDAENEEKEKELLEKFFNYIKKNNVDMIIGFNSNQFDLPTLMKRAEKLGVNINISKLNTPPVERIKIKEASGNRAFRMEYTGWSIDGIIVIDVLRLAERDIMGVQRYNLKDLADELGVFPAEERVIIKGSELWKAWDEIPELVLQYLEHDVMATYYIYEKTLRELQEELVRLLNKDLQYVVFIKTSKLVESRILDKALEEGYIMPRPHKEKGGYSGALVLPPMTGKNDGVSVDDYASLYPNLIRTYNISLETFIGIIPIQWMWKLLGYRPDSFIEYFILEQLFYKLDISFIVYYNVKGEDYDELITGYQRAEKVYLLRRDIPGFIAESVKEILKRRLEVKKEMKQTTDEKLKQKLNIEQLGLKKLANSMYGYLGYVNALTFRTEIAEAVTSAGRMTNYHTVMTAISSKLLTPVYGDTDSSMFQTILEPELIIEGINDEWDIDEWTETQFNVVFEFFEKVNKMIDEYITKSGSNHP